MSGGVVALAGQRIFLCAEDGPLLDSDREAVDLIGELFGLEVETIAIPTSRLGPGFLDLRTRIAGEIIQKLVNYRYRPTIVGDISKALAGSKALQDFVRESNRGTMVWFVADLAALEARLADPGARWAMDP